MLAGQPLDQVEIERLGETRVGDGGRQPELGQLGRGLRAFGEACAERQDGDRVALADDPPLADLERDARFGHRDADAVATRITYGRRPIVDRDGGGDHVGEFALVRRGHDDEPGQAAEIGGVERARMGRTVGADESSPIDREANRQRLDRDVMHDLIVASLQERRINRAKRLEAFGRQARREGYGMLLGDADVERPLRKRLGEYVDASACGHRRRHGDDAIVLDGRLYQIFAENLRVGGRGRFRFDLLSGRDVEFRHRRDLCRRRLPPGRNLSPSSGHDVDQDRTRRRREPSAARPASGPSRDRRSGRHRRIPAPRTRRRR